MTAIIGVDPGKSGAIALLRDGELAFAYDMPVAGSIVSGQLLATIVRACPLDGPSMGVIEDVHAT